MTHYGMVIDTKACIGCYACTVACKVENGSPAGIWAAPVLQKEVGVFPDVRRLYLPMLCNHCSDAPCISACPCSAIQRRPDGIVAIDQNKCCGSRACLLACPYGAIHFYHRREHLATPFHVAKVSAHEPGTAQKCTFCSSRVDRGLDPACVEACPTGARIFADLSDDRSKTSLALRQSEGLSLATTIDTRPSIKYLVNGLELARADRRELSLPRHPQQVWGVQHAAEFWLLGAGAGIFIASRWLTPDWTVLGLDVTIILSMVLVALGGLVLMSDLGRPLRFYRAFTNSRQSWVSRGAFADFFFLALVALLALPLPQTISLPLTGAAVAFGLVVIMYPGLALSDLKAIEAWRGAVLPAESLVDALLIGVATNGVLIAWSGWASAALPALAMLSILRTALTFISPGHVARTVALLGNGLIIISVVLAILNPAETPVLGAIALGLALLTSLWTKLLRLGEGERSTPFGPAGELWVRSA